MMGKMYVEILSRIVPPYKNIPNVGTYKIYIKIESEYWIIKKEQPTNSQ